MKRLLIILGLAAAHLVISVASIATGYSLAMDRFDHEGDATLIEISLWSFVNVLVFPIFHPLQATNFRYGAAGWLFVLANSLLWGFFLYFAFTVLLRLAIAPTAQKAAQPDGT